MKILRFHNGEGSTGKTTFTALFASWLASVTMTKTKVMVPYFGFPCREQHRQQIYEI